MTLTWYAIKSRPNAERKAEASLQERGFDVFLPLETEWKRRRTGRERVSKALIPGYLFVGLNPGKSLYFALQADGVASVVGWGGVAQEIRSGFVYDLRARQLAGEFDHTEMKREAFRPGARAKVTLEGPYKGQIGEILKADKAGRVEIMLCATYNWKAGVHIDDLELVEEPKQAA